MTPEQIAKKYLRLIDRHGVTEEIIHQFLASHPALLPLWWPLDNVVFSKLPLGNQHVVDFAFARENSGGVTWHLIEIERPLDRLFSKSGDPAARVVHGLRQVQDWRVWFRDNRDYVARNWPFGAVAKRIGLTDPETVLVIGRRDDIGDRNRARYNQIGQDSRTRLITFDRLTDHLSWPAIDRQSAVRTCRFINGEIREPSVVSEMQVNIQWTVIKKSVRDRTSASRRLTTRWSRRRVLSEPEDSSR